MSAEQQSEAERIQAAHRRNARLEKVLGAMRLPGLILGAAAGVVLVAFGLAPLMGLTLQGIAMCGTVAAVAGGGVTFGFVDKYACRFGERNLGLSMRMAGLHINRAHEEFKQTLPLDGTAKKAFIQALTDGIKEKLHIGKPLALKKSDPAPAPKPRGPLTLVRKSR